MFMNREWVSELRNVVYTYNEILFDLKKKKEICHLWYSMDELEDIMLMEISQTKNKYYDPKLIWGI